METSFDKDEVGLRKSICKLTENDWILDCPVVRKQECLTQDDRECRISFEREIHLWRCGTSLRIRDDAEVLVVGFHQDVARAEMDLVPSPCSLYEEESITQRALAGDFESRDQPLQSFAP
jgi:hypothetical protein